MWKFLYNIGLLLASPVIVGILLAKPRCRRGFPQRLGLENGFFGVSSLFGAGERIQPKQPNKQDEPKEPTKPVIWVHAVSLGEAVAAAPLVRALHQRHPEFRYIVTTVTETGREAVEQRLAGVAEHRYAPLDFSWSVADAIDRLRPVLYLFVETELWPNILWTLRDRNVPVVLVNGRLSSRSFRRQNVGGIRSLYRSVLRSITLCLMQTERDRERIVTLGASPDVVHATGNIKFDQPLPAGEEDSSWRRSVGLDEQEQLILAGSTHPGEEEQLVSAYASIVQAHPSAVLMMAPRHIERVDRVDLMIRDKGFVVQRRSRIGEKITGPRIIILDTRGELARAYRDAVVAFVGGTLVPVGGHNLLEPAVWGKPVLFGPYTDHCAEVAAMLEERGGGRRVAGTDDIVRYCCEWLSDQGARDGVGQAARRGVLDNQGALQRSLDLIEPCLNSETTGGLPLRSPSHVVRHV
ncbi:MAG: 3-deoxy-D-manno-octulosonic acid transferase [Nitrospira sp.]|nr:3-deoxy-D-manno-octulosonic acid transferase [Nitrospira sp.]